MWTLGGEDRFSIGDKYLKVIFLLTWTGNRGV